MVLMNNLWFPGAAGSLKGSAGRGGLGREPVAWRGNDQNSARNGGLGAETVRNDRIDCPLVKYNGFGTMPLVPASGRQPQRLSRQGGGPGREQVLHIIFFLTRRAF